MILKRIATGIKEQDWFVVIIEIMIVVVGIFIGLQVDDWNEERKQQQLMDGYYDRLLYDMDRTARRGLSEAETATWIKDRIQLVDGMLKGEKSSEEDLRKIRQALPNLALGRQLRFYLGTITELETTGNMRLIGNDDVKATLIYVKENFLRDQAMVTTIRNDNLPTIQDFNLRYSRPLPVDGKVVHPDVDFKALKNDPVFRRQINVLHRLSDMYQRYHQEQAYFSCKVIKTIGVATGKTSKPNPDDKENHCDHPDLKKFTE